MNVLLLRPQYDAGHRPAGFPIGLGYLAAVLERAGHRVIVRDLVLEKDWRAGLSVATDGEKFGLAGISCMGVQYRGALRTAEYIRKILPAVPIVFGGAQPTIVPVETLAHDNIDFVIRGEGEYALLDLVDALDSGGRQDNIPGLSYKDAGIVHHNPARTDCIDLDKLPFPAYHLFPMKHYFSLEIPGLPPRYPNPMQIFTSRGCPYQCIYCHDLFGKRFRPRSPGNVVAEMEFLNREHGVGEFLIYDDNFTMDLDRARDICRRIIASGLRIGLQFPNGIRADRIDQELLDLMIAAGTHAVTIGIESGSPRIQKLIKKGLNLENVSRFLEMTGNRDVVTNGSFIIGFPGETARDIWRTMWFARRLRLDYAFFAFATPYQGTELEQMARQQNLNTRLLDEAMDVTTPHIATRELSFGKLRILFVLCYLVFYTRPRRLFKLLASFFRPALMVKYLRGIRKYVLPALKKNDGD